MSLGGIALATDFALLIVAAAVLSYVARLTGQPTIVAYILTGVVVGPIGLGIVGEDQLIEILSELGLGFLLFLLGIEMRFDDIKEIMRPVGVIAVGQAVLQAIASTAVALALEFTLFQSLMLALATTFGATPIIVKVLGDKGDLKTLYGKADVGILIFQDIYLVLALAILAVGTVDDTAEIATSIGRVLILMALIGLVAYAASKYVLPSLLRASAANKSTLFTVGIAWAFVFIFAAEALELSVELGAFIAGLSLAQLPYSTELKERMRPATNFFIAVFFASIALQMERGQLLAYWQEALLACAALLVINFAIVFGLFYSQRFDMETSFLGTISMLQVSEFSVVLGALAVNEGFVEEGILGFLSLMALVTMPISTYYVRYNREIFARVEPYLSRFEREDTIEAAPVEYEDHAVIVGYNRFTAELATLLEDTVEDVVVVEDGAEYVEELAEGDHEFIFGNARHGEIRQEANVAEADVLVSVATRDDVNRRLVEETPETISIVRATTEESAQRLRDDGADYVVETAGLVGTELAELLATFDDREAFDQRLAELSERARSETLRANESVEPTAASRDGGRDRTRHRDDDRDRRNDENGGETDV
ncbi:Kef-type transport system (probable substrate potassium) [Natrialba magadii ATCC 43099]|uniref:Kef-type transport system (Probable substrate potassium) n=1 Tax=Natrialba magadii (strain ATCC 43099 / DSM 3394 / CCM 3739 / CIP 104546 / IAM 13178 / JCM 8861 / NBRC 102185 / NCIMB 2190 / MS3) TaxID=547559 RepID=D3SWJ3_NATMM|nr:cation:proton antiporter [Natrialba magadii]ADD03785.1 Kef-type transport system (probable substrate potassium) [Natrialba magadii ATCC 43099]ELY33840.1 sodium/hydrogen exchanger [Natrialba magadii ATCC 43099]